MFCNKCGRNMPDDSAFCPGCGAPVTASPGTADAVPYRPAPAPAPYRPSPVYASFAKPVDPREREASKSVLIFGIIALAFSCTGIISFVGLIFAFIARSKVKAYESEFGPATGKAQIGKIFYIVSIPLSIVTTVTAIVTIISNAIAAANYMKFIDRIFDGVNNYMN